MSILESTNSTDPRAVTDHDLAMLQYRAYFAFKLLGKEVRTLWPSVHFDDNVKLVFEHMCKILEGLTYGMRSLNLCPQNISIQQDVYHHNEHNEQFFIVGHRSKPLSDPSPETDLDSLVELFLRCDEDVE